MKAEQSPISAEEQRLLDSVTETVARTMLIGLHPDADEERIDKSVRLFVSASRKAQQVGYVETPLLALAGEQLRANLIPETISSLHQLERDSSRTQALQVRDGLACFVYLFTIVTKQVLRSVLGDDLAASDPRFHDPEFISVVDIALTTRFLDAMTGERDDLAAQMLESPA